MAGNYFILEKYFFQHLILLNKNGIFELRAIAFLISEKDPS
jgi:hypothetical protein